MGSSTVDGGVVQQVCIRRLSNLITSVLLLNCKKVSFISRSNGKQYIGVEVIIVSFLTSESESLPMRFLVLFINESKRNSCSCLLARKVKNDSFRRKGRKKAATCWWLSLWPMFGLECKRIAMNFSFAFFQRHFSQIYHWLLPFSIAAKCQDREKKFGKKLKGLEKQWEKLANTKVSMSFLVCLENDFSLIQLWINVVAPLPRIKKGNNCSC